MSLALLDFHHETTFSSKCNVKSLVHCFNTQYTLFFFCFLSTSDIPPHPASSHSQAANRSLVHHRMEATNLQPNNMSNTAPPPTFTTPRIKTRLLIISDTHASLPYPPPSPNEFEIVDLAYVITGFRHPLPSADVVLYCGDLTQHNTLDEYITTFSLICSLNAILKIVIAGNHDFVLDAPYDSGSATDETAREVQKIIRDAERCYGVKYLTEGAYGFLLQTGAFLRVYASPYTPECGSWAFQYPRADGHNFAIPLGIDVAMTHGPPYGILDELGTSANWLTPHHVGCDNLFKAVALARPRIHCFGHIHEA